MDSITANASGDALSISSDTPGVPFTLTTSTTDGGSDNTQTSATAPNTLNASGELLTDSGSISYDDLDLTDTSLVTRSFVSATASAGASLSSALDAALQDIDNAFTITGAGFEDFDTNNLNAAGSGLNTSSSLGITATYLESNSYSIDANTSTTT